MPEACQVSGTPFHPLTLFFWLTLSRSRSNHPPRTMISPTPERLRRLVRESDLTVKDIATKAGVPYENLRMWVNKDTKKIDLAVAESVWKALTGEGFTR